MKRRDFIKLSSLAGSSLIVGVYLPGCTTVEGPTQIFEPNAFLSIDSKGAIVLWAIKPELGQGIMTSMPMLIAEELEVAWSDIEIKQAMGDPKYGSQGVGGSSSIRRQMIPMRKAGAAAREMLIEAASNMWKTDKSNCFAERGKIHNRLNDKSFDYKDLVESAGKLPIPEDPTLKDPKYFKLIGKPIPRVDTPEKVNGSAKYSIDIVVPKMLFASVIHPPVIYAGIESFDASKALALKGVMDIFQIEHELFENWTSHTIAVVADTFYTAVKARELVDIIWDTKDYKNNSTAKHYESLKNASKKKGTRPTEIGDVGRALREVKQTLTAEYELPYLSHAPMEPMNCVVDIKADSCEIWVGTQSPGGLQQQVADHLQLDEKNVNIHVPYLGGGFGRRSFHDFVMEAVDISKKVKAPVKLIWTREDDIQQGPFRQGSVHSLKAGIDPSGNISALIHKAVAPSITAQNGKIAAWHYKMILGGIHDSLYQFPNFAAEGIIEETLIPIHWWRTVYHSTNPFAHESFMDEMANATSVDPLTFRMNLLKDDRMKVVLQLAANKAEWDKPLPAGAGRGIAAWFSFGTYCAQVAEVSRKPNGKLKIDRIVIAVDCGMNVNPDTIKAQMEGSVIYALTAAIKDPITIENGSVKQSNFHDYRVIRMNESPKIDTFIIKNNLPPGGIGEPGVAPLAPALGNAVFNATGKRIRKLPFDLDGV